VNKVKKHKKNIKTKSNISSHDKSNVKEDFDILVSPNVDNSKDTVIITSDERGKRWLEQAISNFDPSNQLYSTYLNNGIGGTNLLTPELISRLAINPQSNITDIKTINDIVRQYINKDDMIGKTYETIESNVNTNYILSYNDYSERRNKQKILDKVKELIEGFNKSINIKNLIRNIVPTAYAEGNYLMCLRKNKFNKYIVDYYPLGVALVSDYEIDGEPCLLIDVPELVNRLRKIYLKDKKGDALFFNNIDQDIKNNYPSEVYNAFLSKDMYAKLDIRYSGVIRIGNLNRQYGLTPMFRALTPTLMLETFENTDAINAKSKAKKIIHQKLRHELMGPDGTRKGFDEMAYAHDNFLKAWKQQTVVITTPPFVESIEYVEPQTENINSDTISFYRSKQLLSLGIIFLASDKGQTVTTASISVKELIKNIDKVTEQIENVLNKWYRNILIDNGIDVQYAPTIKIESAEQMSMEMKQEFSEFLFTKLGSSYETAMKIVGIDIDDEKQKRDFENKAGYSDIFLPHPTSFTVSDSADKSNPEDNIGGRPKSPIINNKQIYDKTRNDVKK
jgi:hypothetical protein